MQNVAGRAITDDGQRLARVIRVIIGGIAGANDMCVHSVQIGGLGVSGLAERRSAEKILEGELAVQRTQGFVNILPTGLRRLVMETCFTCPNTTELSGVLK